MLGRKPAPPRLAPPRRGAFDYMIQNILDETPRAPPPRPPSPAPRDPPHVRVVVNIEIVPVQHRRPPRASAGSRWAVAALVWLAVVLLLSAAHAQPTRWESHRQGFMTYGNGTDPHGGVWQSQSYRQGFTTYTDAQGPGGQTQHCRTWQQGWQTFTECN